jgi:Mg2+-importing ATPase
MAIATDRVDPELVERPRRWNIRFIRDFMIVFGVVSSIFDFLTFAALVFILKATPEVFRTGWFVESVMTEVLIILVMRTWKPFYTSLPSGPLLSAMIIVLLITLALPYSPLSDLLGLTPLPVSSLLLLKILLGPPLTLEPFADLTSVEEARACLEKTLNNLVLK